MTLLSILRHISFVNSSTFRARTVEVLYTLHDLPVPPLQRVIDHSHYGLNFHGFTLDYVHTITELVFYNKDIEEANSRVLSVMDEWSASDDIFTERYKFVVGWEGTKYHAYVIKRNIDGSYLFFVQRYPGYNMLQPIVVVHKTKQQLLEGRRLSLIYLRICSQ